jgi:hypothetical protein
MVMLSSIVLLLKFAFSLFKCINDKTKTQQGDVGRFVRSAALTSMKSILLICAEANELSEEYLVESVAFAIQRCSDNVDNTRLVC